MSSPISEQLNGAVVISPVSISAGAVTSKLIDATGRSRARFVFAFGANSGTSAALSAGLGVYNASTSGDTYTLIAGAALAAVTSGVLSNNVMVIDTAIPAGKPWLKVSGGSILSTAIVASCIVELYDGITRPDTATTQQLVVVN